ncbi:hypothetical protein [Helicobacter pylori]|uniref:hypothetical protein n=1 Tax=Helicobacter pylori TaxID=210 RepID=UPI00165AE1EC|nr:hypothetical protein [Helicobacter pylori]MBH0250775.1 hypothetical protein [Helicobacter pylori]
MGKFTKNNFLNTFNKIKEFFRHSQAKKDENLASKYIPNDELKKDLLDIDNPNTTENFKPKNASEIWQFALNS